MKSGYSRVTNKFWKHLDKLRAMGLFAVKLLKSNLLDNSHFALYIQRVAHLFQYSSLYTMLHSRLVFGKLWFVFTIEKKESKELYLNFYVQVQNYTKSRPSCYNIKLGYVINNNPLIHVLWFCQHTKASVFVHKESVHSFRSCGSPPSAILTGKEGYLERVGDHNNLVMFSWINTWQPVP